MTVEALTFIIVSFTSSAYCKNSLTAESAAHDRKSDKETQSPMLRVFKEMIQKEHKDTEKANLLKEKLEKSNKKPHTRSRSKIDQKVAETASVDHSKYRHKKKMAERIEQDKNDWAYNQNGSESIFQPYQSEKRDSWWLWKDAEKKKTDDSCSCATCPLKRIMRSDYACVGFLIVLFLVSVLITSMVVFKTMPLTLGHRIDEELPMDVKRHTITEAVETTQSDIWSPDLTNRLESYSGIFGSGYGDSSFRDSNMLEDEGRVSRELASVIGADRLYDVQGSEKLREFYKKLIQTDAQIKKLKQGFESDNIMYTDIDNVMNVPERYKRSLKFIKPKHRNIKYSPRNKHNKRFNIGYRIINSNIDKAKRLKRDDSNELPEGYLFEKKEVLIQYKPFGGKRQFPKCSHMPKDSKSHEKHLKHPFYQNSQRLDELLDHILDRHIPEIVRDPIPLELLFSNKVKCNHKSENKSYNLDSYKNMANHIERFSNKEATEDLSTYKTTNQNIHDNFKEYINSENFPMINTYIRNITLFDQAIENNRDYENLYNIPKTEPNYPKSEVFKDPSSKFMMRIHTNNNLEPSSINSFGNMMNKNQDSNIMNPTLHYENYKILYKQNMNHNKVLPNKIDRANNILVNKNDNLNMRDTLQDHVIEMAIDDPKIKKKFDMNLDYSDLLLPSSPKLMVLHTTNSINQDKQNINLGHYNNEWRSKGLRKLLQIEEEEDDTLGYEDLKEVLADEMEAHDETERRVERKKRNKNLPDVYNSNWKGPVPLYPDEINAIIKQAAMENVRIPVDTKDVLGLDTTNNQISDTDYIEDYFDNKNDRLVEIAQAYSDYGVLQSKKGSFDQNKEKTVADKHVTRNKLDILKDFDIGTNVRPKKGAATQSEEGIRFVLKPGKDDSVVKESDILTSIQKHFKICKPNKKAKTTGMPYIPTVYSSLPHFSTISFPLDKTHKCDSKNIDKRISVPKRGLKSIEYIDTDVVQTGDVVDKAKEANNTVGDKITFIKDGTETDKNLTNVFLKDELKDGKNNNNVNATLKVGDFFAMMSDWFRMLAKLSGETNQSERINSSTVSRDIKDNNSLEVAYPSYDSDMIENIGHRSRVLMSIEDNNASLLTVDLKVKEDKSYNNNIPFLSTVQSNIDTDSKTLATQQINKNITTADNDQVQNLKDEKANMKNKTFSKRSVQTDSKSNYWNDIYDDEYGVNSDYFEKSTRDKHSADGENFVKKSKNWIKAKVKSIAKKIRSTKGINKDAVSKNASTESVTTETTSTTKPKVKERRIRNIFGDDSKDPNDFAALTANMKKVVREATNAVKETRKLKVREDSKEDTMASSLMQQLVRLMADVVDFQVQQKTCAKLPPDLQNFLEWLTSASEKEAPLQGVTSGSGFETTNLYNNYEKSSFTTPEDHVDDRTTCLESIQAVQELLKQYDEMYDEDKSKMTGVKEYLQNQLNFLNKKLSTLNEFNIYKYYKKRETPNRTYNDINKLRNTKLKKRRIKRRINKFIRNYSKKHTRTTAGISDIVVEAKDIKKNR